MNSSKDTILRDWMIKLKLQTFQIFSISFNGIENKSCSLDQNVSYLDDEFKTNNVSNTFKGIENELRTLDQNVSKFEGEMKTENVSCMSWAIENEHLSIKSK